MDKKTKPVERIPGTRVKRLSQVHAAAAEQKSPAVVRKSKTPVDTFKALELVIADILACQPKMQTAIKLGTMGLTFEQFNVVYAQALSMWGGSDVMANQREVITDRMWWLVQQALQDKDHRACAKYTEMIGRTIGTFKPTELKTENTNELGPESESRLKELMAKHGISDSELEDEDDETMFDKVKGN